MLLLENGLQLAEVGEFAIFLTVRTVHTALPPRVKLPLAGHVQSWLGGQRIRA
jgi:hypothetical protein